MTMKIYILKCVHAAMNRFCVSADYQQGGVVERLFTRCRCELKVVSSHRPIHPVAAHNQFECLSSLL